MVRAIDKDVLMQEIAVKVVDGREERYQFTWPDKKKSVLLANAPISKTLRPCREESVDFDNTENLYIEGDNLEVLKLLQETYLGKIKMIYIDPPYNTGNDFVYNDEFGIRSEEWDGISGDFDETGNQIVGKFEKNTESNGRFHTDWLNMIYPRLRLAKDLLTEDGVIFTTKLRGNIKARSSRRRKTRQALTRRSRQESTSRTMCLQTAMRKRALNAGLQRTWMQPMRFASMPSYREDFTFLPLLAITLQTGRLLSMKAPSSTSTSSPRPRVQWKA